MINERVQGCIADTLTIRCTLSVLPWQSTPDSLLHKPLTFNTKQHHKAAKVYLCTFFEKIAEFAIILELNPNRSLDFHSASSLFLSACNVRVEAIAGYGETRTAARWRNKDEAEWKRKAYSLITRLFRSNDRFGLNDYSDCLKFG